MEQYISVIESNRLDDSQELLRALSHRLRLQIVNYIDKHPNSNVKQIYKDLGIEQSVTSQHLRILRDANVVSGSRQGKEVNYSINYDLIRSLSQLIDDFV